MNLDPAIVESLRRINFVNATDVQERVIPLALEGKDLIVRAKTGTGKTAAFLVPLKQMSKRGREIEALIVVPTRELAVQISDMARKLGTDPRSVAVVYGGASINVQMDALRRNPNIVIGTPGRIIDLMERGALRLHALRFAVLDEADTTKTSFSRIPYIEPYDIKLNSENQEEIVIDQYNNAVDALVTKLVNVSNYVGNISSSYDKYTMGSWIFSGQKVYMLSVYLPPSIISEMDSLNSQIDDLIDTAYQQIRLNLGK